MNLNKVILIGRISQQPIMNDSKSGLNYVRTSIAINRESFGQNKNEITDFIPLVAFGNNANFISKYFNKGDLISVVGQIQMSSYTTKSGDVASSASIIVDQIKSLEPQQITQARRENMGNTQQFHVNIDQPIVQPKVDVENPTFHNEIEEDNDSP